jgi:methyl-accepting chemotaxis protein
MQWLGGLSVKYKILTISLVGVVGFVGYLLFNFNINTKNSERLAEIRDVSFPVLESANSNIVLLRRIEEVMSSAISTGEMDTLLGSKDLKKQMIEAFDLQRQLQPGLVDDINSTEAAMIQYYDFTYALSETMLTGGDLTGLAEKAARKNELLEKIQGSVGNFRETSYKRFTDIVAAADEASQRVLRVGFVIAGVTIGVLLATSFAIASFITKAISSVAESLHDISQGEGDLTRRIEKTTDDELGDLVTHFNSFVHKLQTAISEVIHVIEPLGSVSTELEEVTQKTRVISEGQQRSSEQASDAMNNMLDNVTEVARYAASAAQAASDADKDAKQGQVVVNNTVDAINELAGEVERASVVIKQLELDTENVGSILDVIKSIAEQTNLLALNAAIEAARAGEQGRGFAVVADEVRTLASRTQDSTSEIQAVIEKLQSAARSAVQVMEEGQKRAELSVDQAGQTGASLEAITAKVESISQMNNQIADATVAQQKSSDAIQSNVSAMRDSAAEAVAGGEKTTKVAVALTELSKKLQNVASQFRV